MSPLDALLTEPLPSWRFVARPIVALLAGLVIWAQFATIEQVSVATGEVVPQGKVKVIQHLEGGIIERIFVAEGARVYAGEPLLRLDLATAGVNRKELLARLDNAMLRRARVRALSEGAPLALPADAAARQPDVAGAERETYAARKRELESNVGALREQVRQRELEIQELEAKAQGGGDQPRARPRTAQAVKDRCCRTG
ncbi:MAG: hypothetical protein U1E38_04735 [Rhodospirillales bacterium]